MSKRKPKKERQYNNEQQNQFQLKSVQPLTVNQRKTFDSYEKGNNLVLHGYAGTGKTFVTCFLAANEVVSGNSIYEKIVIIRSVVPCRDIGFLPGTEKEKAKVYEEPYKEIFDDLYGTHNAYDFLKMQKKVEFTTSSFLRGMTFNNCILILDEAENFTFQELDTVITRVGRNTKIMICGDFRQTDFRKKHEQEGITQLMRITKTMKSFDHIEFMQDDIVRSGLVKEYIITRTEMGF